MAVPSEHTVAVGDKVTASLWNGDVRDGVNFLLSPPRVSVSNTAAHSHTSGTSLLLTWDTEAWDTDTMHSTVTNTSRLTAVTAGTYQVVARLAVAANATGIRSLDVRKNAAGVAAGGTRVGYDSQTPVTGAVTSVAVICDVALAANDYIECFGFQTSGGALSDDATAGLTFVQMRWVTT
jgi:hypothetical protein